MISVVRGLDVGQYIVYNAGMRIGTWQHGVLRTNSMTRDEKVEVIRQIERAEHDELDRKSSEAEKC